MTEINPVLVEKYQLILQSDPRAKVFAPLAEAYRKMGLIDEGIQVCLKGLGHNPDFASGRVALGRLYLEKGNLALAAEELQKAVDLSPENLLAQGLLGETYLKLRRPKEALGAYKMLLFLNPHDEKAQGLIRKLESLTADEYDDDVFAMTKLRSAAERVGHLEVEIAEPLKPQTADLNQQRQRRDLERFVSLADAFLVRNDFDRARETLMEAERAHGSQPDITRRLTLLNQRFDEEVTNTPPPSRLDASYEQKIALLKELGSRVTNRRRNT